MVEQLIKLPPDRTQNEIESTCTHHWLIESPNGPTSEGICKRCGATRTFRNFSQPHFPYYGSPDNDWRDSKNLIGVKPPLSEEDPDA